ncbi:hypothetical protein EYF80_013944 [Liparis tanakae]|uniref:Uncharacterized protein n=1 Tax=Liparis tanakae TaxID=230148 RepID=A0A4Z2ID26_9TELE|nr:hypothetical protein EYF80_013944 [Liparis tanakae]
MVLRTRRTVSIPDILICLPLRSAQLARISITGPNEIIRRKKLEVKYQGGKEQSTTCPGSLEVLTGNSLFVASGEEGSHCGRVSGRRAGEERRVTLYRSRKPGLLKVTGTQYAEPDGQPHGRSMYRSVSTPLEQTLLPAPDGMPCLAPVPQGYYHAISVTRVPRGQRRGMGRTPQAEHIQGVRFEDFMFANDLQSAARAIAHVKPPGASACFGTGGSRGKTHRAYCPTSNRSMGLVLNMQATAIKSIYKVIVFQFMFLLKLQMVESLFSISGTDAHGDLRVFPLCLNLSVLLTVSLSPPQPGPINSLPRGGWDNEDYSVKHY